MKNILTAIGLCFIGAVNAQTIAIKGGISLPSGSFANANLAKNDNGFANSGGFGALAIIYPVYKKINIAFETGLANQRFKENEFQEQLQTQDLQATTTTNVKGGYKSSYALIGAGFIFNKNKFDIGLKVMGGFTYVQAPAYTITQTYTNSSGTFYYSSQNDMTFAIGWGLDIAYHLPHNFQLMLSLDNLNASLQFKETYTSSNQEYKSLQYEVYRLGIGIGYRF